MRGAPQLLQKRLPGRQRAPHWSQNNTACVAPCTPGPADDVGGTDGEGDGAGCGAGEDTDVAGREEVGGVVEACSLLSVSGSTVPCNVFAAFRAKPPSALAILTPFAISS